jgi:hypothetical protein
MCACASQPRYHNDTKLGPVASVTAADLRAFVPRLLSRVRSLRVARVGYRACGCRGVSAACAGSQFPSWPSSLPQLFVTGLVFGNASEADAGVIADTLISRCSGAALEMDLRNTGRVVQLPYAAEVRYPSPHASPHGAAILLSFSASLTLSELIASTASVLSATPYRHRTPTMRTRVLKCCFRFEPRAFRCSTVSTRRRNSCVCVCLSAHGDPDGVRLPAKHSHD